LFFLLFVVCLVVWLGGVLLWSFVLGGGELILGMHTDSTVLDDLNRDQELDAGTYLNEYISNDENISQFFQTHIASSYTDSCSFLKQFKDSADPVYLSVNIQSLNSKFDSLRDRVRVMQCSGITVDLIILQETWDIKYPDKLILPGFQSIVYRTRQVGRGGGVGIYVRNGLNFKERKDLENYKINTFENIVLEVQYPNKSIFVSNVYRSPTPPPLTSLSEHMDSFLETLDSHLIRLADYNAYVFTDSNINLLHPNDSAVCSDYLDTLITNGFIQLISKATRVQNCKASLIDHIITNTNQVSYNTGTVIDDLSDHFMNYIQISNSKNTKNQLKDTTKRLINVTNTNNLKTALRNNSWEEIMTDDDVNSSFNKFWNIFENLYNTNFPVRNVRFNRNKHKINGYMKEELLACRATKLELHKISLRNKTPVDTRNYIEHRNMYNNMLRQHKQKYYTENLEINIKNPKRSWQLLKEAANLNKPNASIEKIDKNGVLLTDPTDIACEFNDFFTDVGVRIAESVKPTAKKPDEYMPNLQNLQELDLGTVNQTHICDIIKSLHPKNSLDIDGISTNLLKAIAIEISWPLAHIFNNSLRQGIFPDRLKMSRTVPIFKAGRADLCDNYRPISLLSTLSKVLEKIVSVQLVNHLDRNKILYEHQYGFQHKKSTEHSIIHAVNYISNAMNENKYTIGVFFDLKKAFDVCSHDILLMKLGKMGISGAALSWFKSYLSNRSQIVEVNGHRSQSRKVKISIMQGSILGPI